MNLIEPTSTTQVLADENLLAIIMDNVDNPQTLFNLIIVLPMAKAVFQRCPRQLLTSTLSNLPSELQQLAIFCVALMQGYNTRPSKIPFLWAYLRFDPTRMIPVETATPTISTNLPNPFGTLRKLADIWTAVEDLANGFVERSMRYIQDCKTAQVADLEPEHYERGHKLRPLSELWNPEVTLGGLQGYPRMEKPQPWSLALKASEIHRVKRALWRLEVFAALSQAPPTFRNKTAIESGATGLDRAGIFKMGAPAPRDYDKGTRILLASLQGFELAELESVYDYLWCEMIGKVYQYNIDEHMSKYDEEVQQARAERKPGTSSSDVDQEQVDFHDRFARKRKLEVVTKDHNRYLTYFMSLGLPFLHRVHQQITKDGGEIKPRNYLPLRYRCYSGLRDTWEAMDWSRLEDIWHSYRNGLVHTVHYKVFNSQIASLREHPKDSLGVRTASVGARYLTLLSSRQFRVEDVWRAGCYMWEGGR